MQLKAHKLKEEWKRFNSLLYSYMEIQLHGHCIRMTRANQKSLDIWFHLHGNIPLHWTHKRVNLREALVQGKRCVVNADGFAE